MSLNYVPVDGSRELTGLESELALESKALRIVRLSGIAPTRERVRIVKKAMILAHAAKYGSSNLTPWRILNEWNDLTACQEITDYLNKDRGSRLLNSPWDATYVNSSTKVH